MKFDDDSAASLVASSVSAFYERHPYPQPVDDLERYRTRWDDGRRRAESHLFWPGESYRDDRTILVAGCGTTQAAKYAMRWPGATVTGIDVSVASLQFTAKLKHKYGLDNLEVRRLPVERAADLGATFDHVVCTGVLHHLADPDAGLRALREAMAPTGALHMMVYAPYGRAGVYLLQDYCRRLGIRPTKAAIADLVSSLKALPPDHPLVPLLRGSPDFRTDAGIADALLHPQDRAYSVPQVFDFLRKAGLEFGRWIRQAPYRPECGALASSPHRPLLDRLAIEERHAAAELFRGTMVRHSLAAYRNDRPATDRDVNFESGGWLDYVPIRTPGTIVVRDRLPPGAAAVLINQNHTYADLFLTIDARQERMLAAVDGGRAIADICPEPERERGRTFFAQLWAWDQIVVDTSGGQSGRDRSSEARP
jgi:SAM-dependent methyltransferase